MTNAEIEWEPLATKLREEIQAHGSLCKMLEEHREALITQDIDRILEMNQATREQTKLLLRLRRERETMVEEVGRDLGCDGAESVKQLLSLCPSSTRPMFDALLEEVNRLIDESRRRVRRNQMVFQYARDLGRRLLSRLNPNDQAGPTYGKNGRSGKKEEAFPVSYSETA